MNAPLMKRIALGLAVAVIPAMLMATPASAASVTLTIDHFYLYDPYTLTADDADTVHSLKTSITTASPNDFFTDICVVHNGVAMQPGHTLSEYGVQSGDTINVYGLPMNKLGHWSITPDEPFLGNEIGMSPVSHPWPTHVELIDGALPVGASLDTDTGSLSGHFEQLGSFSATFRVNTICGDWDIDWSGDVYSRLPDTGLNTDAVAGIGTIGALGMAAGATLIVRSRRRVRDNSAL